MEITRKWYLAQLTERMRNGRIKVVTGIRRCGKSHLLFVAFRKYLLEQGVKERNIISVSLDDVEQKALINPLELSKYVRSRIKGRTWHYVFIDEIQECVRIPNPGVNPTDVAEEDRPRLFVTFYDVLNGLSKLPNVDIYVTGSNSRMLSKDIATDFRGRGDIIRMHPLSFSEYLDFSGLNAEKAFSNYLRYGGLPLAVLAANNRERERYLKNLFDEIYLKDIVERNRLKNDYILGRLCDVLSSSVGSLTNPHKLVNSMKTVLGVNTSDSVVKKYLDYLEDSFIFEKAARFDVKGKYYLDYPSKYYAEDVGLRNARLNFRQFEETHLMENVLFNELSRRGFSVDVGVVPHNVFEGGRHIVKRHEVDFVVNDASRRIYVQSAFRIDGEAKRQQETESLRRIGDSFRKIVVVGDDSDPWTDENGIVYVGVIPFLADERILSNVMS